MICGDQGAQKAANNILGHDSQSKEKKEIKWINGIE
jgi:hypothetical protein